MGRTRYGKSRDFPRCRQCARHELSATAKVTAADITAAGVRGAETPGVRTAGLARREYVDASGYTPRVEQQADGHRVVEGRELRFGAQRVGAGGLESVLANARNGTVALGDLA
jgi:hypothetical protein